MLNLKRNQRVKMTEAATNQGFQGYKNVTTGVIQKVYEVDGVTFYTILRDGYKDTENYHHQFWQRDYTTRPKVRREKQDANTE